MTKRVSVDYENNAEEWWAAARESDIPAGVSPLIRDVEPEVIVTDAEATIIQQWAEVLPGWDDGPEHAPTALIIQDA